MRSIIQKRIILAITQSQDIKFSNQLTKKKYEGQVRSRLVQVAVQIEIRVKPGLHMVGRIVSMCLRRCRKKHITALQVSIAKISFERLLL